MLCGPVLSRGTLRSEPWVLTLVVVLVSVAERARTSDQSEVLAEAHATNAPGVGRVLAQSEGVLALGGLFLIEGPVAGVLPEAEALVQHLLLAREQVRCAVELRAQVEAAKIFVAGLGDVEEAAEVTGKSECVGEVELVVREVQQLHADDAADGVKAGGVIVAVLSKVLAGLLGGRRDERALVLVLDHVDGLGER